MTEKSPHLDPLPVLCDSARLFALESTGLLDTPAEPAFDRLTQLASRLLHAPLSMLALVADERQFFKSVVGLGEPWLTRREIPLTYSLCKYTVALGEPFVIEDARQHSLVRDNLAVTELNIVTYAGVPLMSADGLALGSLCVCDSQPRVWTDEDIALLQDLAALAMTEIARREAESALAKERSFLQALMDGSPDAIYFKDTESRFIRINRAHAQLVGLAQAEDAAGKSDFDFHASELARKTYDDEQRVIHTGHPFMDDGEFNPTPEGAPRWFLVTKLPLRDADGNIIGIAGISRDITARKRAEHALLESEERHRIVFELTTDNAYTFAVQPDGKLTLEWSMGNIVEATGYMWEELAGSFSLYHPDEAGRVREDVQKTLRGEAVHGEYRIVTKSGETRWSEVRRYPVYDVEQGRVVRFYGLARDITERKQTERALRESETRYRAISELITDTAFAYTVNPDGSYSQEWTTGSFLNMTGYTPEEIGSTLRLYHPDDADRVAADLQAVLSGQTVNTEYRIVTKDGEVRWAESYRKPEVVDGRVVRFYGAARDITGRKQAEAAQRESEERFSGILNIIHEAIVSIGEDQRILIFNEGAEQIFGYSAAEVIGQPINRLIPETAHSQHALHIQDFAASPITARSMGERGDIYGRRKNGQLFPAETSISKLTSGGRTIFTAVLRDISERKQAEDALRKSEERHRVVAELLSDAAYAYTVHPDGSYTLEWTTGTFFAAVGYMPQEIVDNFILFHPDNAEQSERDLLAVLSGQTVTAEYRVVTKSGATRWVELDRRPEIVDGRVVRFYGAIHDITERKLAEAALRESEERFRQLAENLSQVFWIRDAQSKGLMYISPAYEQIWGRPPDELYSSLKSFSDTIHPEDRPRMQEVYDRQGRSGYDEEYRIVRPDGTIRWIWSRSIPVRNAAGEVYRIVGIADDITERKLADEALHESNERFRELTENLDQVFWIRDAASAEILYISPAYEKIWGRSLSELLNDPHTFNALHPDDRQWVEATYAANKEVGYDIEYRTVHTDGTVHWIRSRAFPVRNAAGDVYRIAGIAEDITERKLADDALFESNERFRELTDNLDQVFWIRDAKTDEIMYVSPAYEQVWGHPLSDLHENPHSFDTVHPEDRVWVSAAYEEKKTEGYDMEYRALRADGTVHWIRSRSIPVRNAEGEVYRIAGIAENITARKQAEAAYRDLVEQSLQGIMVVQNERIVFANSSWAEVVGYTPEELLALPDAVSLIHPDDIDRIGDYLNRRLAGEAVPSRYELRMIRKDGGVRWLEQMASIVMYGGKPATQTSSMDITARKLAEVAYRDLVENSLQGIIVYQANRIQFANPAFADILGYTLEEVLALENASALIHPDDQMTIANKIRQHLQGDDVPSHHEYRMLHKDGSIRWLEQTSVRVTYQDKPALQASMMDVTERKLAEARQMELFREREKLNTLARFIGDISHDLRTPLSVMKSSLYLLGKQPDPDKRERHLTTLDHQVTHIGRVLEDMLTITRLDGMVIKFDTEAHDLSLLIAGIVDMEQKTARQKNRELRFLPASTMVKVCANPELLADAMRQLLLNALNFTLEGGQIEVEVALRHETAYVSVRDNGIGIAAEDLPLIFGAFYRVDKARGMDTGGTGLGLTIAKKIIELHGGTISVESTPGEGSIFTIALPIGG